MFNCNVIDSKEFKKVLNKFKLLLDMELYFKSNLNKKFSKY